MNAAAYLGHRSKNTFVCAFRQSVARKFNVSNSAVESQVADICKLSNIGMTADELNRQVDLYSKKKFTPVSLKSLMETGRGQKLEALDFVKRDGIKDSDRIAIQIACFLHRELPVRLAQCAAKLDGFPIFQKSPSIKAVSKWYKTSFRQLRSCPVPQDPERELIFAGVLESIFERHASTLITMAKGAHELRIQLNHDVTSFAEYDAIQAHLDQFYRSRINLRILIGQYLALRDTDCSNDPSPDTVGLIDMECSPYNVAMQAIQDASYVCTRTHGDAPAVSLHGSTDLTFPYFSSHLSYMLQELLKNSMRATVEHHGLDDMPPIRVVIADGEENEDVVIKVSDEGGGIKRSHMNRVWSYLYTTADPSILESMLLGDGEAGALRDFDTASPLAGLGYGLPISRNYARTLDGDLFLISMEGFGTDSFIYLPRLGRKEQRV